ncbi:S41 family peptidase [Shewanella cutis]|uniref:Peptidase S41 n=1 Tax=Shewanella cutis TaxID=2766780 RepID=A0ABS9QU37_9GAMM|nr:S41 family peptidase [Shewanella sp. PS-2]MCG9962971.1 peptidase S41 [Shewanella sp. PS-2]
MSFSYRTVVTLLSIIICASLIKLAFFAIPEKEQPTLTTKDIRQDLYILLSQIEQHSAFYALDPQLNDRQLKRLAGLMTEQYQDLVPKERFAAELTKLLNTLKDPGTQVAKVDNSSGELPFSLRPVNEQWLALDSKNNPISSEYPFVTHIDGIPLSKWISASQAYLSEPAKNSQEMQLIWLKRLNLLREDLGLNIKPYVLISLINDNLQTTQVTIALSQASKTIVQPLEDETELSLENLLTQLDELAPTAPTKPDYLLEQINPTTARLKINDLHVFELDKMQQEALRKGMEQPLLIVDLRQAKGFSPKLLTMLSRYQDMPQRGSPSHSTVEKIMGFAHYRRSPELRNDYLKPLNFKPLDVLELSSPRLNALTQRLPTIDENRFSPWFVRTKSEVIAEGNNRLALLVSPLCKQECEWIAYRAKAWSRVNLIGEKTSGDFARQYQFTLPNSDLEVRFSSSLTYDATGELLSGKGTEPDIWLPQNNDLEWQGLVSLVKTAPPKALDPSINPQTKLAQSH